MKILLDAYWWHAGPTSLQRAVRHIVDAWVKRHPEDELAIVVRKPKNGAERHPYPENVRVIETVVWPQLLSASLAAPMHARRFGIDKVVTQNYAPVVGPSGVLIHDLLFETNPEWFTMKERLYFAPMKFLARRADRIFATTESEAARIASSTGGATQVDVVGMGVGEGMELLAPERLPGLAHGSFLLTVGRLNARKNLATTIEAAAAAGVISASFPLVVVGEKSGRTAEFGPSIETLIERGAVLFPGFVSDAQLRWLYENTRLMLFLSLGEGFGLPPVEAAGFGAPVLASRLPVFEETLGARAQLVDPLDGAEIAAAIRRLLREDARAPKMTGEVPRYSWNDTVERIRASMAALPPL